MFEFPSRSKKVTKMNLIHRGWNRE